MKRYSNAEYVLKMKQPHGLNQILTLLEQDKKDMLYQEWLVRLPHMGKNFVPFDTFYKKRVGIIKPKRRKSKEEILKRSQQIKKQDQAS